jgi:transcriptional regulator
MYQPKHFRPPRSIGDDDRETILGVIRAHPLGILISPDASHGILANPVPFLVSDDGLRLQAHVARANPHWRALQANPEALVIFQGGEHYISPSWYPAKAQTGGRVVPTWNYVHIQIRGHAAIREDTEFLTAQIAALTSQQESSRPQPWSVSDAPLDYIENLVRSIVGIEIEIREMDGKFKLSQNRPDADQRGVTAALSEEAEGQGPALAAFMRDLGIGK